MTTLLTPPLGPIVIKRWVRAYIRDARVAIADTVTPLLLGVIHKLNTEKDNGLSWRLHELADRYDTRPTGEWD